MTQKHWGSLGKWALATAMVLGGGQALAAYTAINGNALGQGSTDGVKIVDGKVVLSEGGSTFPILWVANAGEDTVSKIDTRLNIELARYRTGFKFGSGLHGAYEGPAPSRTTVDTDGNVFVLNRHFDGRRPVLMKILATGGIDRNGNGQIDTSTSGTDVKPLVDLNGNGQIDPNEIQDERVAWAVEVGDVGEQGQLGRAACIGTDGNVWVGMFYSGHYYKVSSATGAKISGPHPVPWNPYGCAVDRNGILWSATLSSNLGRMDTNVAAPAFAAHTIETNGNYGIAIGNGKAYSGGQCAYTSVDAVTLQTTQVFGVCGSGLSVDGGGDIVTGYGNLAKYNKTTGAEIWQNQTHPASYGVGVVVDGDNNVWQVDYNNFRVTKFAGATGQFLAQIPVGQYPYTYSDATGIAARTVTTQTGFWSTVLDGGRQDAVWNRVCWGVDNGTGSSSSESRASNDQAGLQNQNYQPRANCIAPAVPQIGQFFELRLKLTAGQDGGSPSVGSVVVENVQGVVNPQTGQTEAAKACDANLDGKIDLADIALIRSAIGQTVPAGDPRDVTNDGKVTQADVTTCTRRVPR